MDTSQPFGPASVTATPLVTELPSSDCAAPIELYARLRAEPERRGLALLESAGAGPELGTIRRTILVARAWLRLEIRGGRALIEPLVPAGERLCELLQTRLCHDIVEPARLADLEDQDRLRAPSVLDSVRAAAALCHDERPAPLAPGLFGAFAYELVDCFERLPARAPDPLDDPDASFVLAGDLIVFDLARGKTSCVTRGLPWEPAAALRARHEATVRAIRGLRGAGESPAAAGSDPPPPPARAEVDVDDRAFKDQVRAFKGEIGAGEIFQGVLSRGLSMPSGADPLDVYRALRARNPSPYMFHFELGDGALLGASPETFLRVEDGTAEIRPIAGTAPRGFGPGPGPGGGPAIDPDLDARLALGLLLDPKEQAEHAMLLDLARNDVARVSRPGTTQVVQQFAIEKYSHVQHLVSRVRGRLRQGLDALHAYRAAANMGTLTGAPKLRAMELIRAAEPRARGFYGGAAGYLLADGRFDSCIVIRSLRHKDGVFHTRAGAGIVWHSDPDRELQETEHKALAVREAVACAEQGAR